MNATTKLPSRQVLDRLKCARCRRRLIPEQLPDSSRIYQCSDQCRRVPVDGAWLENQIAQAIGGRVPEAMIPYVIGAFIIADQIPGGVRVWWIPHFPAKPQPSTSSRPATMFVAANAQLAAGTPARAVEAKP
ncbi:hypothetical protein AB0B66_39215 [Catellatospora sp. NPDC049111]|uniref:hypothetical protein n=1 Tax=Catellatospora sp. NPDC049111 TaxID=3155271 RepID=UPI0033C76308